MMRARYLTKRHLTQLGFTFDSRNRHFAGVDLDSFKIAHKLRGVKDNELKKSPDSLESKQLDEGLASVYPSTQG
jgi:hypothetical protein